MTLEMEPLEIGVKQLAATGWKAGQAFDPETDAELMEEDRIEALKRAERNAKSGFFTCKTLIVVYIYRKRIFYVLDA